MPPARNYRISGDDILNRSCAFHAGLESILLGDPSKILFQQYRPKADNGFRDHRKAYLAGHLPNEL